MCLIGFSFGLDDELPLLIAANRDEYYARPTEAAHWWPDQTGVYAGRDTQAGGSWLALHRAGRLAALTNFREGAPEPRQRSRGELVIAALDISSPVPTILAQLSKRAEEYAGFSLLIFDWHDKRATSARVNGLAAYYLSNRDPLETRDGQSGHHLLSPGVHGLSNGPINAPWPKSERLIQTLHDIKAHDEAQRNHALLQTLTDGSFELQDSQSLPRTGVGDQLEHELAPAFIHTGGRGYGTRSTAIVSLSHDGMVSADEWTWQDSAHATYTGRRSTHFISGPQTPCPTA